MPILEEATDDASLLDFIESAKISRSGGKDCCLGLGKGIAGRLDSIRLVRLAHCLFKNSTEPFSIDPIRRHFTVGRKGIHDQAGSAEVGCDTG